MLMNVDNTMAQSALQQLEQAAGKSAGSVNVPKVSAPSPVGSAGSAISNISQGVSTSTVISNAVAGAVIQGLINNVLFSSPQKSQAEIDAERMEQERIEMEAELQRQLEIARQQEIHDNLMESSKGLPGSQSMDFKALDGDMENMRKAAADQFEPDGTGGTTTRATGGTDFFGDNVTPDDIDLITDPHNDPMIVDLRDARSFIVENIKTDHEILEKIKQEDPKKESGQKKPECNRALMDKKLNGLLNERQKFLKTIELTKSELQKWEEQKNAALMNAAKTGLEYFIGDVVDKLGKKGEAAARLENILTKNAEQMAKDGLDIIEIQNKIQRMHNLSRIAGAIKGTYNLKDWEAFLKDGWSALVLRVSESNAEIREMLNNPQMQTYFNLENPSPDMNIPTPELRVLLDIANIGLTYDVFGSWVAKKAPIIAFTQFSIDQIYNVTDWILSYRNICKLREVSGQEMAAANYQQQKINETISLIQNCR